MGVGAKEVNLQAYADIFSNELSGLIRVARRGLMEA